MVPLTHRLLLVGGLQAQALLRHCSQRGGALGLSVGGGNGSDPSGNGTDPSGGGGGGIDPDERYDQLFVPYLLLACFLVAMAGLMSGLTLGLMSLDQVDIEILRRSGTERQKRLAQRIQPVLLRPHVLLVTLLVCNALAAEALPLVLDRLADPVTAIVVSVTVVLLFGEIIPQAACSRYGLQIGAYSAPFVQLLMFLTAPVSFPIGWVLDRVLGDRHTALFRRAELKALVDIHKEGQEFGGQLSADEVSIIKGALDLTHKRASDAMTPLDLVFMLPADAVLDEHTLTAIMASGHSRIPVHHPGDKRQILGIMLVKELIMVDKDQGKTVGRLKVRSLPYVRADTPLYDMLKLFELGRSHMAVLMQPKKEAAERQRKESEAHLMLHVDSMSDDPSMDWSDREEESPRPTAQPDNFLFDPSDYEPVGIITIEDVLEELLQVEILDETDQFVDNLQRTPISTTLLLRNLPPHLREVFSARSLLPRIGGAAFMQAPLSASLGQLGDGTAAAAAVDGSPGKKMDKKKMEAALMAVADSRASLASAAEGVIQVPPPRTRAPTTAVTSGAEAQAAVGSGAVTPVAPPELAAAAAAAAGASGISGIGGIGGTRGGSRTPSKPHMAPLSPRPAAGAGSGATTPVAGGTVRAGLLYKQGSVGAALVAEKLRQEVAQQLAAAAAAQGQQLGGSRGQPRSRPLSPLPGPRRNGSRHTMSSPEGAPLAAPLQHSGSGVGSVLADGTHTQQPQQQSQSQSQLQQPHPQQQLRSIFPGLRRSRSDAQATLPAAPPRPAVPLPPPPARRSTNVTQRVQDQMDLLQPLLTNNRQGTSQDAAGSQPNP